MNLTQYLSGIQYLRAIYDDESHGIALSTFEEGYVLTHQEFNLLMAKVEAFYQHHTPDNIAQHNQALKETEARRSLELDIDPRSTKSPKPGWVYLLKSGRYYKIGTSATVDKRTAFLSTQWAEPIEVLAVIQTDNRFKLEQYWHQRFAPKRLNGEWFDLSPEDIQVFAHQPSA